MFDSWMPRDKWESLVRGEGCPLCQEVAMAGASNKGGYFVADLGITHLRFSANQYVSGYSVLICRKHVREPYELLRGDRVQYFEDLMRVGKAIEHVFSATKLNYEILGNSVPHLHCHIIPRYFGDPFPNRPVPLPFAESVFLSSEQYQDRVEQIRQALHVTQR